jgi:hypothetical protein
MANYAAFNQFPDPPRSSGDNSKLLLSLAILGAGVLLLILMGAAAGVWLVWTSPDFGYEADEFWEENLAWVVETSVLPPGEQAAVLKDVKRLGQACHPLKMSLAQQEEVLTALENSPVFVLLDVGAIERDFIDVSGLSAAEKERGRRAARRAARGVHAGKISSGDFYSAWPTGHFYPSQIVVALDEEEYEDYYNEFPEEAPPITDADVRAAIARLAALADAAGIPDEEWTFDISDEFKAAVDKALAVVEP